MTKTHVKIIIIEPSVAYHILFASNGMYFKKWILYRPWLYHPSDLLSLRNLFFLVSTFFIISKNNQSNIQYENATKITINAIISLTQSPSQTYLIKMLEDTSHIQLKLRQMVNTMPILFALIIKFFWSIMWYVNIYYFYVIRVLVFQAICFE